MANQDQVESHQTVRFESRIILPDDSHHKSRLTLKIPSDRNGISQILKTKVPEDIYLEKLRQKIAGQARAYIDDFNFCTNRGKIIQKHKEATTRLSSVLPRVRPNAAPHFQYCEDKVWQLNGASLAPVVVLTDPTLVSRDQTKTGRAFLPWSLYSQKDCIAGPICDIFDACCYGDASALTTLLDRYESDLTWHTLVDMRASSVLHYAAQHGHAHICELLLDYLGEEGQAYRDRNGQTPVMVAALWKQFQAVRSLLSSVECPLEIKDNCGYDLADYLDNLTDTDMFQCIHAITFDDRDETFISTCLHKCVLAANPLYARNLLGGTYGPVKGYKDLMHMSLSHLLATTKLQNMDATDVHQVAGDEEETGSDAENEMKNINDILKLLADHGEEYTRDGHGRLPLWYAARSGNTCLIPTLINSYSDHVTMEDVNSAIYAALSWKHPEAVKTILQERPETVLNEQTRSCLISLIDKDWGTYAPIMTICKDSAISQQYFSHACSLGDKDLVQSMIGNKIDVDLQDHMGLTAIHQATQKGRYRIVEILIARGAKVNVQDGRGDTPLHHLCMMKTNTQESSDNRDPNCDFQKTLNILLNCGNVDPNLVNIQGRTALLEAVLCQNKKVQEYLRTHFADELDEGIVDVNGVSYSNMEGSRQGNIRRKQQFRPHFKPFAKSKSYRYTDPGNFVCLKCQRHFEYFGDAGHCHGNFRVLAEHVTATTYRIKYRCEKCIEEQCEIIDRHCHKHKYVTGGEAKKRWEGVESCYVSYLNYACRPGPYCARHAQALTKKIYVFKVDKEEGLVTEPSKKANRYPKQSAVIALLTSRAAVRMGIEWCEREAGSTKVGIRNEASLPLPFTFHSMVPVVNILSPLYYAIQAGRSEYVDSLLHTNPALATERDDRERTPLELAIDLLSLDAVDALLPYVKPSECPQALHRCVSLLSDQGRQQETKEKIIRKLLRAGWHGNMKAFHPTNPYSTSVEAALTSEYTWKVQAHWKYIKGITPLQLAFLLKRERDLDIFIKHGSVENIQQFMKFIIKFGCENMTQVVMVKLKDKYRNGQLKNELKEKDSTDVSVSQHLIKLASSTMKQEITIKSILDFLLKQIDGDKLCMNLIEHLSHGNATKVFIQAVDDVISGVIKQHWSSPETAGTYDTSRGHLQYVGTFLFGEDECSRSDTVHIHCLLYFMSASCKLWKTVTCLQAIGAEQFCLICITTPKPETASVCWRFTPENMYSAVVSYLFKHIWKSQYSIINHFLQSCKNLHFLESEAFRQSLHNSLERTYPMRASVLLACLTQFPIFTILTLDKMKEEDIFGGYEAGMRRNIAIYNTEMKWCLKGMSNLSRSKEKLVLCAVKLVSQARSLEVPLMPCAFCFCPLTAFLHLLYQDSMFSTMNNFYANMGRQGREVEFTCVELLALTARTQVLLEILGEEESLDGGQLITLCCGFGYLRDEAMKWMQRPSGGKARKRSDSFPFSHCKNDDEAREMCIRELFRRCGDANHFDSRCGTPLFGACYSGLTETVQHLIDNGAQPSRGFLDKSPLRVALEQGHQGTAQSLLRRMSAMPASLLCGTESFSLMLMLACQEHTDRTNVAMLLGVIKQENVLDLTLKCAKTGKTALHFCTVRNDIDTLGKILDLADSIDESRLSVDLDLLDESGATCLWYATAHDYLEATSLLLVHGAKANIGRRSLANVRPTTPGKPTDHMEDIINQRNTTAENKPTPGDVNVNNRERKPMLSEKPLLCKMIFYSQSIRPTLHQACGHGDLEAVEHILSTRPKAINQLDHKDRSALFYAVINSCHKVTSYLLRQEVDINRGVPCILAYLIQKCRQKMNTMYGVTYSTEFQWHMIEKRHNTGRCSELKAAMSEVFVAVSKILQEHEETVVITKTVTSAVSDEVMDLADTLRPSMLAAECSPVLFAQCVLCALFAGEIELVSQVSCTQYKAELDTLTRSPALDPVGVFLLFHDGKQPLPSIVSLVGSMDTGVSFQTLWTLLHDGYTGQLKAILDEVHSIHNEETQPILDLALMKACKRGEGGLFSSVLQHIPRQGIEQRSACIAGMHMATAGGHQAIVEQLNDNGIDGFSHLQENSIDEMNDLFIKQDKYSLKRTFWKNRCLLRSGWNALHQAARFNRVGILQRLQKGSQGQCDLTELGYIAACHDSKDIIQYIIHNDMDCLFLPLNKSSVYMTTNSKNIDPESLIVTAMKNGHADIVRLVCNVPHRDALQSLTKLQGQRLMQYASLYQYTQLLEVFSDRFGEALKGPLANIYKDMNYLHILLENMRIINDLIHLNHDNIKTTAPSGETYEDSINDLFNYVQHALYKAYRKNCPEIPTESSATPIMFTKGKEVYPAYAKTAKDLSFVHYLFQTRNDEILKAVFLDMEIISIFQITKLTESLRLFIVWACKSGCARTLQVLSDICNRRHTPITSIIANKVKYVLIEIMIRHNYTDTLDVFMRGEDDIVFSEHGGSLKTPYHVVAVYGNTATMDVINGHSSQRHKYQYHPYECAIAYGNFELAPLLRPASLDDADHREGHPGSEEFPKLPEYTCVQCLESVHSGWMRQRDLPAASNQQWLGEPTEWPYLYLRQQQCEPLLLLHEQTSVEAKAARGLHMLYNQARRARYKHIFGSYTPARLYKDLTTGIFDGIYRTKLLRNIENFVRFETLVKAMEGNQRNEETDLLMSNIPPDDMAQLVEYAIIHGYSDFLEYMQNYIERPADAFTTAIQFGQLGIARTFRRDDLGLGDSHVDPAGLPIHMRWLLGMSRPGDEQWHRSVYSVDGDMSSRLNHADCWLVLLAKHGSSMVHALTAAPDVRLSSSTTQGLRVILDSTLEDKLDTLTEHNMDARAVIQSGLMLRDLLDEHSKNILHFWPKTDFEKKQLNSVRTVRLVSSSDEDPQDREIEEGILTQAYRIPADLAEPIVSSRAVLGTGYADHVKEQIQQRIQAFQNKVNQEWKTSMVIEADPTTFPADKQAVYMERVVAGRADRHPECGGVTNAIEDCIEMIQSMQSLEKPEKESTLMSYIRRIRRIRVVYDENAAHNEVIPNVADLLNMSTVTWRFYMTEDGSFKYNRWTFSLWVMVKLSTMVTMALQRQADRLALPGQASWRSTTLGGHVHLEMAEGYPPCFDNDHSELLKEVIYGGSPADTASHIDIELDWSSFCALGSAENMVRAIDQMTILMCFLLSAHERRWLSFKPMCQSIRISQGNQPSAKLQRSTVQLVANFLDNSIADMWPDLFEKSMITAMVEESSSMAVYSDASRELVLRKANDVFVKDAQNNEHIMETVNSVAIHAESIQSEIVSCMVKYGTLPFDALLKVDSNLRYNLNNPSDVLIQQLESRLAMFIVDRIRFIWKYGDISNQMCYQKTKVKQHFYRQWRKRTINHSWKVLPLALCYLWKHVSQDDIEKLYTDRDILVCTGQKAKSKENDKLWCGPAYAFKWSGKHIIRCWVKCGIRTREVSQSSCDGIELLSIGSKVYRIGSIDDLEDLLKCIPQKVIFCWDSDASNTAQDGVAYLNVSTKQLTYKMADSSIAKTVFANDDLRAVLEAYIWQYTDDISKTRDAFHPPISLSHLLDSGQQATKDKETAESNDENCDVIVRAHDGMATHCFKQWKRFPLT